MQVNVATRAVGWLSSRLGRWFALCLAALVVASAAGCVQMLPGAKLSPGYMVNRGDHYYVGTRCLDPLVGVAVWVPPDPPELGWTADRTRLKWQARVVSEPVAEFELLGDDQPGVQASVTSDDDLSGKQVTVRMTGVSGRVYGFVATLIVMDDGMVGTASGPMTWDEFMKIPVSDYACYG